MKHLSTRAFWNTVFVVAALVAVQPQVTYGGAPEAEEPDTSTSANIIETAEAAGQFDTLLQAVEVAGLTKTLSEDGPFTVFAPTDAAFAALPDDQLKALLNDPKQLRSVLLYHVVSGSLTSKKLKDQSVETLNGNTVQIEVSDSGITVNKANVVQADVQASNGVIHAIDAVLIPPEE